MTERTASRRVFLQSAFASLGTLALVHCGGDTSSATDGTSGSSSSSGGSSSSSSSSSSGSSGTSGDGGTLEGDSSITAASLAVGSGAFLEGKDYGNPFTSASGSSCAVYKSATEGPCHSNTYNRKDVSDGLVGLPTRIELLVVDGSCNPVANAIVEIWYASPAGTYSEAAQAIDDPSGYKGSLSDLNVGFCTGNDSTAAASNWLRGWQTTDENGRVTLDGIFPGWYSGRAPHIHFIVTVNGQATLTSQLLFDETLTTTIYTKHGSYSARGDKDTTNAKDNVGLGTDAVMSFAQQSDGAMVVWKQISVG